MENTEIEKPNWEAIQKGKLSEDKVQKYKEELEKLEIKYNGVLTPQNVLREAQSKASPLHEFFDWENDTAGEKWRIWQARILIGSIKVKVNFDGTVKEYKRYLNVRISPDREDASRGYVNSNVVMINPDYKEQIIKKAIKEVEYWKKQYSDYNELETIFKSIQQTKKKLKIV